MEQGWDPEVKEYFVRILNTIAYGLFWMLTFVTAGLYFRLAYRTERPVIYNVVYYVCLFVSLFFLLRHFYRIWKK